MSLFSNYISGKSIYELLTIPSDRSMFHDHELPDSKLIDSDVYICPFLPANGIGCPIVFFLVYDKENQLVRDFNLEYVRVRPSFTIAKLELFPPYGNGGIVNVCYSTNLNELPINKTKKIDIYGNAIEKFSISKNNGLADEYAYNEFSIQEIAKQMGQTFRVGFIQRNVNNYIY